MGDIPNRSQRNWYFYASVVEQKHMLLSNKGERSVLPLPTDINYIYTHTLLNSSCLCPATFEFLKLIYVHLKGILVVRLNTVSRTMTFKR